MSEMAKIAYCGLDCEVCDQRTREKRETARKLRNFVPEMNLYVKYLGDPRYEGWPRFKEVLDAIAEHPECPGCQQDGGLPDCRVRNCARERAIEFCYKCRDFPCGMLDSSAVEASRRIAGL
jgi:hypothetical protein